MLKVSLLAVFNLLFGYFCFIFIFFMRPRKKTPIEEVENTEIKLTPGKIYDYQVKEPKDWC